MPTVAMTAVASIISFAASVPAVVATVAGNLAISAATAAVTMALTPKERAEGSSTAFRLDTDAGIPFAFGTVGVGGVLAYRKGFGATNRYQALVSTLSGAGPIKAYVSFAADDEVTTFGANDVATSGDHAGAMWLQRKLGTQPQTHLTSPTGLDDGATAPGWTSAHDMSGRACVMWTLYENSKMTEFKGGVPKPLHVIEGKYGWDPRLDSTWPGGSGSCRLLTPSTWVWIDEGCMAALNWAIGMWEGPSGGGLYGVPYACSLVGGIGSSLDGIDVAALINGANVADANGWKLAAYPTTKDDKYAVYTNMLQASGCVPSRKAGKISCISNGEEQASILTVTAADTAGPVEIALGQSRLERINTVLPRFYSSAHRWEMTQASAVTDAAWLTEDGGKRSRGFDYPYVPAEDQSSQLAYYDIANAREPISGMVPFKPHMRRIEPGDCFTFAEPGFLLDGVKVKCQRRSYDPMSGIVKITFRQETDAKHAAAMGQTGTAPDPTVPDTPFPGPWPGDDTIYGPDGSGGGIAGDLAFLDTVGSGEIDDGAVAAAKLADGSVDFTGPKVANVGDLAVLDEADTAQIAANAVTNEASAETSGAQTLTGTTDKTIQTVTYTATGGPIEVRANFYLTVWHPTAGGIDAQVRVTRDGLGNIFDQTITAINGDLIQGWQTPIITDTPSAGSVTYRIIVTLSNNGAATQQVQATFLSAREFKR